MDGNVVLFEQDVQLTELMVFLRHRGQPFLLTLQYPQNGVRRRMCLNQGIQAGTI